MLQSVFCIKKCGIPWSRGCISISTWEYEVLMLKDEGKVGQMHKGSAVTCMGHNWHETSKWILKQETMVPCVILMLSFVSTSVWNQNIPTRFCIKFFYHIHNPFGDFLFSSVSHKISIQLVHLLQKWQNFHFRGIRIHQIFPIFIHHIIRLLDAFDLQTPHCLLARGNQIKCYF